VQDAEKPLPGTIVVKLRAVLFIAALGLAAAGVAGQQATTQRDLSQLPTSSRSGDAGPAQRAPLGGLAHPVDWRRVVRMFRDRDLTQIQALRPRSIEGLPLDQRNCIALEAARSLSIAEYIGAIGDDTLWEHFARPQAEDSPAEAECRRQWGINMSAAELLRHLAENRLIDDPRVVPYLIEGMSHPDRFSVGQKCFYALAYLTRHKSGEVYWARLVEDRERQEEITSWWRDWWPRHQGKHPVFDLEVEGRARAEVLRVARAIEMQVKPCHPELWLFSIPEVLALRWSSRFFQIEYNPRLYALVTPLTVDRDDLPWVHISSRLQTQDLSGTLWSEAEAPTPPVELRGQEIVVYSRVLDGTDIVVEVLAASMNEGLIRDLNAALADTHGTGLSASEGLEKPQP